MVPIWNNFGALFVTVTSKISLYTGVPSSTVVPSAAVASTVLSAGAVSSGGIVSCTVTYCTFSVLLLFLSTAVQVTFVVPIWNSFGASFETVTSKISLYTGVPRSTMVPSAAVASTVLSAGAVSSGGIVSTIVTF